MLRNNNGILQVSVCLDWKCYLVNCLGKFDETIARVRALQKTVEEGLEKVTTEEKVHRLLAMNRLLREWVLDDLEMWRKSIDAFFLISRYKIMEDYR